LWRVLINLVPDFLAVLRSADRVAAFHRYIESHQPFLSAYWHNYVVDLESPPAAGIIEAALGADRSDLATVLEAKDPAQLVADAVSAAEDVLKIDRPTDCYLMIGMGAANAGELVIQGRGEIFICLEHFTGRANPETFGLGLSPDLIPLWVGHELAHTVRYTSPVSASAFRQRIEDNGGYYDFWLTSSRITLRELIINEGLAVHAAKAVAPGFDAPHYFGYSRRQYHRLRELEAFLRRAVEPELDRTALGLRLRYLSDGMSPAARLVAGRVLPERSGYYLGYRMTEALVEERGIAAALRASVEEFRVAEELARRIQTA
jgi:hypothetical protein